MKQVSSLISIVVPLYDEAENLALFYQTLCQTWQPLSERYIFELIFINDGSADCSGQIVRELLTADPRVKYLEFTRNFGKEIAVSAGLHHASGLATIIVDADLQHPLARIPEFIGKWEAGSEVVIGIRSRSEKQELTRNIGSAIFNWLLYRISDVDMPLNNTDFRLLDRKVVAAFAQFTEHNRITRGLIDWMGFRYDTIQFEAPERTNGKPRYTLSKLINLMFNSFTSMSFFPIRLAGYLGLFITAASGTLGLFVLIEEYLLDDPLNLYLTGAVQLAIFNTFLIGIVLICLGAMSLYLAHTYTEAINRPMYILRDKVNFND